MTWLSCKNINVSAFQAVWKCVFLLICDIFSGHKADFFLQFITKVEFSEQKIKRSKKLRHYLYTLPRLRQEALMCPPHLQLSPIWCKKKKATKKIKMFAGCSQVGMKKPYDDVEYWDESTRADPNPHLNAGVSQHNANISEQKWGKNAPDSFCREQITCKKVSSDEYN